jgi:hypothetical protein
MKKGLLEKMAIKLKINQKERPYRSWKINRSKETIKCSLLPKCGPISNLLKLHNL